MSGVRTSFWLDEEREFVVEHRGLKHPFFKTLDDRCRSTGFLRTAAQQIYHVVLGFPFHIAAAIGTCRDETLLRALVHNLYEEVGGEDGEPHIAIYRSFLRALNVTTERPANDELWLETMELESTCAQLYRSENMGTKLGSLFAFEMMSSPMVAEWDDALRRSGLFRESDYQFFTIHIDIEIDHVTDIEKCAAEYIEDAGFRQSFRAASTAVMTALERFWDRMNDCEF